MCQANIRKQAAQIALKKIVLLLNLKINLLLSIPVLLSVHQIFVQYLGLHGKTVVFGRKRKKTSGNCWGRSTRAGTDRFTLSNMTVCYEPSEAKAAFRARFCIRSKVKLRY